jgi:hypothetical protein
MSRKRLLAKAVPSTVDDQHVIKVSHLGWHDDERLAKQPGYFAAVITYDVYAGDEPDVYNVYLLRTGTPDGRWLRIESTRNLFHDQAEAAFNEYDKLAFRPGRV